MVSLSAGESVTAKTDAGKSKPEEVGDERRKSGTLDDEFQTGTL